ncbi:hypothetical protein T10_5734 [Trichinella papuae]|uniref:Uncharacterized protein n=1 Tax=Trichinella papuae TaxID=268474 RepID=A0A0V1N855_9BILA|nr:hypothetical protein T10_5734 [Trichinella papuae]
MTPHRDKTTTSRKKLRLLQSASHAFPSLLFSQLKTQLPMLLNYCSIENLKGPVLNWRWPLTAHSPITS